MGQNFRGQKLDGADFSGQDLTDADFRGANLQNALFKGANVSEAIWSDDFDLASHLTPLPATPKTEAERMHAVYFDADGHLKEIPVGQTRQRFVLEHLVTTFEPGVEYPEKEINERLKAFHPDFATLRRYLIDHQLMARSNNIYWRTQQKEVS
jgi:hypothetical protein